MHYFKLNIGDYAKKTGRLSMLEHGAYTLLMHACYDREKFPTEDEAYDWCWARSDEEKKAVKFVLDKFFKFTDGVYIQNRIKEEIEKYHENALTNKRIAIERESKRRIKAQRTVHEPCSSVHEPPPNHKPLTINQEPRTNKKNITTESHNPKQETRPTFSASVCLKFKELGITDVNPMHPKLLRLIDEGATMNLFEHAAITTRGLNKGFAYALGVVDNALIDQRICAINPRAPPASATKHATTMKAAQSIFTDSDGDEDGREINGTAEIIED